MAGVEWKLNWTADREPVRRLVYIKLNNYKGGVRIKSWTKAELSGEPLASRLTHGVWQFIRYKLIVAETKKTLSLPCNIFTHRISRASYAHFLKSI